MHPDDSRYYALDYLRFFAALSVLVAHWGFVFPVHYLIFDLRNRVAGAEYGLLGVELFFLISGFVILQSAEGKTVAGFVWSRAKRLYPTFWICCTLTALVTAGFAGFAANLTMLPELFGAPFMDSVYWTLAIEITFYAFVALAIRLQLLKHTEALLWVWLATTLIPINDLPLVIQFGSFFIGGAACYLISRKPSVTLMLLLAASWLSATQQAITHLTWQMAQFKQPFDPAIVAAVITCSYALIYAIATRRITAGSSQLALSLGALTYPLYLLHDEIGKTLLALLPGSYAFLAACLFTTLILLSYAIARGERWALARLSRRSPVVSQRNVATADFPGAPLMESQLESIEQHGKTLKWRRDRAGDE